MSGYDAVVVGSGPNGLAAAITLAEAGRSVIVLETADEPGGGCRSAPLTLPGFTHDVCAAVHPLAAVSPVLRALPLAELGVELLQPAVCAAHPLDGGRAAALRPSLAQTVAGLGGDGAAYRRLVEPMRHLVGAILEVDGGPGGPGAGGPGPGGDGSGAVDPGAPAPWPSPWPDRVLPRLPGLIGPATHFALGVGARSARSVAARFGAPEARALLAGTAAHAVLPLDRAPTGAFGVLFAALAHLNGWPVVRGGSGQLTAALVTRLRRLGGEVVTGRRVTSLADLPPHRAVLFDVTPRQLVSIAGGALPAGYRRALLRFRHGPGVFKVDWALAGPVPWSAPECRDAGTVHVGGTFEEVAAAEAQVAAGRVPERPFCLVTQPGVVDPTRAPTGQHTLWAYCHVPPGCEADMTGAIEAQVERFAPGFRDLVLARHAWGPRELQAYNANDVGGDINGGLMTLGQLVARPVARPIPYRTPTPGIYLCSASTPPGAGVHGLPGYLAARAALAGTLR